MKNSGIVLGTLFLSVFSIVGKVIGAIYRIPLTNIIGSEGLGLYQLAYPIFVLTISLSSSGVSVAVAKMVSEDSKAARSIFYLALKIVLLVSVAVAIVIAAIAGPLSVIQGNADVKSIYYGVACAIVVVSSLSVVRGYLRGKEQIKDYAISEFVEQIGKLVFGLLFAYYFYQYGVVYGVIGCFVGIAFASIVSLLYSFAVSKVSKNRLLPLDSQSKISLAKYASFSTLSALVIPLLQVFDTIFVVNLLQKVGFGVNAATKLFGLSTGVVASVVHLPFSFVIALETITLPKLSKTYKSLEETKAKTNDAVSLVCLIAIPSAILLFAFAKQIIYVLYFDSINSHEIEVAISLLKISSISLVFMSLVQITSTTLQSGGRFSFPLISLSVGGVVKIMAMFILIPRFGILGFEMSTVIYFIIASLLNVAKLRQLKLAGGFYNIFFSFIIGGLTLGISYLVIALFGNVLSNFLLIIIAGLAITSVCGILVYFYIKKQKRNVINSV